MRFFIMTGVILNSLCFQAHLGHAEAAPYVKGEQIKYNITNFGLKVGTAKLTFEGIRDLDGEKALLIVLNVRSIKFVDEEEIYLNPETFLPMAVKRDLTLFGNHELISEFYDQDKGEVRIIKTADGKTSEQKIEKDKPLENIYGFIYRFRKEENDPVVGNTYQLSLPTKDIELSITEKKIYKAAGKKFDAIHLESRKDGYDIWIDEGPGKLPVRISGPSGSVKPR